MRKEFMGKASKLTNVSFNAISAAEYIINKIQEDLLREEHLEGGLLRSKYSSQSLLLNIRARGRMFDCYRFLLPGRVITSSPAT